MEQLHRLINDMQTKFEKAEPIPEDWIKVYNALITRLLNNG